MLPKIAPDPVSVLDPWRRRVADRPAPDAHRRALLTHRACAPEDAGMVRQLCRQDRAVLPRWHQDDRGQENAHRGVHVRAPEGAYAGIRAWHGREHWLTVVVPVAIAVHRTVLRREQLSPATFRLWAEVESGYAQDQRTGRRCIVRPATVATVMGMHVDVARTCRRVARRIGLQVVVLMGRMLNVDECTAARRRGSRQRGLSTETALTIPDPLRSAVDTATPTRGRPRTLKTHLHISFPDGLAADQTEAAPPPLTTARVRQRRKCRQVASDLIRNVPWLATERPGRLAPALTPFVTCSTPWTAQDVTDAVGDLLTRNGHGTVRTDLIRTRPAVLLAALLRQLDPETDHPGLAFLDDPAPPVPCGRPGCDEHGWITLENGLVAKCPTCPPGIRRHVDAEPGDELDEPAF